MGRGAGVEPPAAAEIADEVADAAIEQGADLVAVGKAAILEPKWPHKILEADYIPASWPATRERLESVGVSAKFVDYMRGFKLVKEE